MTTERRVGGHENNPYDFVGVLIPSKTSKKVECVHALKGLALPRASYSGEVTLLGKRRLRCGSAGPFRAHCKQTA